MSGRQTLSLAEELFMESTPTASTSAPRKLIADAFGKGVSLWYPTVHDSINSMRLAVYTSEHLFEGTVFPAMQAVVSMQEQWANGLVDTVRGEQSVKEFGRDTWSRLRSGARFNRLVNTLGRDLFGSARFEGETILAEDEYFKLTYIPPKEGVPVQAPLFHAGGAIPYGDRLFRLMPEANLYGRFTDRGMPVYAMELRGDRYHINYGGLTIAELVDSIERLSTTAYEHAGRKLVLEGYCGHGMQALAYLAAKPEDADKKLCAVALFVSPVHGPDCSIIADLPQLTPGRLSDIQLSLLQYTTGYVPGDGMRLSLDLSLKKNFLKTPLGRFVDGWNQVDLAKVKTVEDLTPVQRKVLVGAYWISAANANRFPIPVDFSRYANVMFSKGLSPKGDIPFSYRGRELSLADFVARTSIPVVGFYGGTDPMIPDRTAYPLIGLLRDRYRHVVHPNAGHISYVFSKKQWDPGHPKAFKPNPVDVILEMIQKEPIGLLD
jgi:pimeloyl-ACP methyl ester carboxylesterase